jgi:hypothetical protein
MAGKRGRPSTKEKEATKQVIEKIVEQPIIQNVQKQRDLNELIPVVNITNSKLTYVSRTNTGYIIEWDNYRDENYVEYKELINCRNSQRLFFEEPWIMCPWDVLVDLKVDKYYKNIIDLDDLDSLFKKTPDELKKTLQIVPNGIKKLIADRAFELRREKQLDSLSIIEVIEKTLNIDLSV